MNYKTELELAVYIDIVRFRENSGVPVTVRHILLELAKTHKLSLFTWDNEFGGLRNISYSESTEVLNCGIATKVNNLWQKSEFNYEDFVTKVKNLNVMLILDPGVLVDEKNGYGTFRNILTLCKSAQLPTVSLLYDVIPLHENNFNSNTKRDYVKYLLDLCHSDKVIAISRYVAEEFTLTMQKILPNDTKFSDPISYISLGTDISDTFPKVHNSNQEKFIFVFGTVEKRKNQLLVMDLFKEILEENDSLCDWKLKIVGNIHQDVSTNFYDLIRRCKQIEYLGPVSTEDLVKTLDAASFTVFASEDEGFGLPIIESLGRHKVCISANFGSMDEVSPFSNMKIDIRSRIKLKEKMFELMYSQKKLDYLVKQLEGYVPRSWKEVAVELSQQIGGLRSQFSPIKSHDISQMSLVGNFGVTLEPRLTIVISTFNRLHQLTRNVKTLMNLNKYYDFDLFILDNCSTDSTQEYLSGLQNLNWHSNLVNMGMLGNLREISKYVSTSHIWVIGDDDFITDVGLSKTLKRIKDNPEVPIIVHNFVVFYPTQNFNWRTDDITSCPQVKVAKNTQDTWAPILEIASFHDNLFTAMYQFVWRLDHFRNAFTNYPIREEFADGWNSAPSASYLIGKNSILNGFWSGSVGIISNGVNSWSNNRPRWHSVIMHEYIQNLTEQGFDKNLAAKWSLIQQNAFVKSCVEGSYHDPKITNIESLKLQKFVEEELNTFNPKFLEFIKKNQS